MRGGSQEAVAVTRARHHPERRRTGESSGRPAGRAPSLPSERDGQATPPSPGSLAPVQFYIRVARLQRGSEPSRWGDSWRGKAPFHGCCSARIVVIVTLTCMWVGLLRSLTAGMGKEYENTGGLLLTVMGIRWVQSQRVLG
jgi:hypothetical protein